MAAGLGFKTFTTGEVLTSADTNGYLMQGVLVFASSAARDAAITSPQEGQFAYLKDTNVTTYYTGSAWANLDTTGMTNPMTTTGDTIYSSSGSTPARLGIGTTGQILTVSGGGIPSWTTPAGGGGKVLQVVQATYTTATTNSTTTYADTGLTASITPSSASSRVLVTVSQPMFTSVAGANGVGGTFKIMRGATNIVTDVPNGFYASSGTDREGQAVFSYSYVDSPSTTSSTTYKTQFKKGQGDSVQTNVPVSTIILMEIGA